MINRFIQFKGLNFADKVYFLSQSLLDFDHFFQTANKHKALIEEIYNQKKLSLATANGNGVKLTNPETPQLMAGLSHATLPGMNSIPFAKNEEEKVHRAIIEEDKDEMMVKKKLDKRKHQAINLNVI